MKVVKISSHEKRTTTVYVATYVAACANMAISFDNVCVL